MKQPPGDQNVRPVQGLGDFKSSGQDQVDHLSEVGGFKTGDLRNRSTNEGMVLKITSSNIPFSRFFNNGFSISVSIRWRASDGQILSTTGCTKMYSTKYGWWLVAHLAWGMMANINCPIALLDDRKQKQGKRNLKKQKQLDQMGHFQHHAKSQKPSPVTKSS